MDNTVSNSELKGLKMTDLNRNVSRLTALLANKNAERTGLIADKNAVGIHTDDYEDLVHEIHLLKVEIRGLEMKLAEAVHAASAEGRIAAAIRPILNEGDATALCEAAAVIARWCHEDAAESDHPVGVAKWAVILADLGHGMA